MTINGELVSAIAYRTFELLGSSKEERPEEVPQEIPEETNTKHIAGAISEGDASAGKYDEGSDSESGSDESDNRDKSILDSHVRFVDLPDLEFAFPELLHWLDVNVGHFGPIEMVEKVMKYPDFEHFIRWVNASLEGLYGKLSDGSESSSGEEEQKSHGSSPGPVDEADQASPSRVSLDNSAQSWMTGTSGDSSSEFSASLNGESGFYIEILPKDLEDEIPEQLPVAEIILDDPTESPVRIAADRH